MLVDFSKFYTDTDFNSCSCNQKFHRESKLDGVIFPSFGTDTVKCYNCDYQLTFRNHKLISFSATIGGLDVYVYNDSFLLVSSHIDAYGNKVEKESPHNISFVKDPISPINLKVLIQKTILLL